jgi:hypothetical protein
MPKTRIQVVLVHNGKPIWAASAPIDVKFCRRMTKAELEKIASETVFAITDVVERARVDATPVLEKHASQSQDRKPKK